MPDMEDETAATDQELESLGKLVDEDSLLMFKDIRDGGAVACLEEAPSVPRTLGQFSTVSGCVGCPQG